MKFIFTLSSKYSTFGDWGQVAYTRRRLELDFDKAADGVAAEDVFGALEIVDEKVSLDARAFIKHLLAQDSVEQSTRQRWRIEDALELHEKIAPCAFSECSMLIHKNFIKNQSLPDFFKGGCVPRTVGGLVLKHRIKACCPSRGNLDAGGFNLVIRMRFRG